MPSAECNSTMERATGLISFYCSMLLCPNTCLFTNHSQATSLQRNESRLLQKIQEKSRGAILCYCKSVSEKNQKAKENKDAIGDYRSQESMDTKYAYLMAYIIMQFCNLNVMHHNTSYRMQKFHCNNEASSYATLITQHYKCARNFSV